MKILFVVASLNPEWGGPVQVVLHTVEMLVKAGVEVVICSPFSGSEEGSIIQPEGAEIKLFKRNLFSGIWKGSSCGMRKFLKTRIKEFDLVHIHEIWHYSHYIASQLSLKYRIPYIITVHGALSGKAFRLKRIKKKIFSIFFEKKIISSAAGIQALTEYEETEIQKFAPGAGIKIIGNGVSETELSDTNTGDQLVRMYPELNEKEIILFLGRIDKIKGLDILADSFKTLSRENGRIHLVIAGPDFGFENELRKLLQSNDLLDRVTFTGEVTGQLKGELFSRSHVYVLPSYSEGFSIAILEAIVYGIPVIISRNCNFPVIEEIGAGLLIENNCESLTGAIREILSDRGRFLKTVGKAKNYILNNYSWRIITENLINWYEALIINGKNRT